MASKQTILGLVAVLFVVSTCNGLTSKQSLEIDTVVRDVFMAENNIPGVGITVVENFGNSTFARGYGFADLERNVTANESTKFCIASISKVMIL